MTDTPGTPAREARRRDVIGTGSRPRNPIPMRASLLLEGAIANVRRWAPPTLFVATGTGLAIAFGVFLANGDYFRAESISVEGTRRAKPARLVEMIRSAAEPGHDLTLWVSDSAIREAIKSEPSIARVSIRRQWPNSLSVEVVEHGCAGILAHTNGTYLVSPEGVLYDLAGATDLASYSGPLLTGFEDEVAALGRTLPRESWTRVRGAGEQIRKANPELGSRISEIHWDSAQGITLVLDDGLRAITGHRPLAETGPVLEAFLAEQQGSALPVATVDLRADDHLAWKPVKAPPPPKKKKSTAVLAANDHAQRLP